MGKPVGLWRRTCLLLSGDAGPCLVAKICLSLILVCLLSMRGGKKEARPQGCRISGRHACLAAQCGARRELALGTCCVRDRRRLAAALV